MTPRSVTDGDGRAYADAQVTTVAWKPWAAAVNALRPFVERHLHASNSRDFDAWGEQFDEGIEVSVNGRGGPQ